MDYREITMKIEKIIKLSDKRQEQKYLRKMNVIPTIIKKYNEEEQDQIREKVRQLPSDELVVIYLSFWENYCDYEIATQICSTTSKVISIKKAALLHLKEMIEQDEIKKELLIA